MLFESHAVFASFANNYLTSLFCSQSFRKLPSTPPPFSALLWACLSFSHFLSWSRRMHFYFVIRLLKSLPQSLSREQGFNKNISWALRMSFLCCSLLGRWGENGDYCHGSGPGNERTYMSREIKYKLEGGGVLCTFNSSHPPTSLSPWGQTGKKSVRLPSHTPLLASFLLLGAICVGQLVIESLLLSPLKIFIAKHWKLPWEVAL